MPDIIDAISLLAGIAIGLASSLGLLSYTLKGVKEGLDRVERKLDASLNELKECRGSLAKIEDYIMEKRIEARIGDALLKLSRHITPNHHVHT